MARGRCMSAVPSSPAEQNARLDLGKWAPTERPCDDAPGTIRTCDLSLRRRTLYPLSYGRLENKECSGAAWTVGRPRHLGATRRVRFRPWS